MTAPPTVTDRHGLEVLDLDTCLRLLAEAPVGRVAVVDGGDPLVLPVTHHVVGSTVAFLTAEGTKLAAALMHRPVAFEVDGVDPVTRSGWSVVVRGVARVVDEPGLLATLAALPEPTWSPHAARGTWVAVRADDVSGRRLGPRA